MNKIKILPKDVYSKIAAGEVIERPSSVVRELLDNSIDAGADEIIVKIEQGGLKKITVSDNGSGISKEDLPLAFSKHATSKIMSVNDLSKINTMGFRGEALNSIKVVSNITLTSNTDVTGEKAGYKISNDTSNSTINVAFKKGTKVEVENLFTNFPVRRKFLKSQQAEWNAIKKEVLSKCFSYLNIVFRLYNNNDLIFQTTGDDNFKRTFFSLYDKEANFEIYEYEREVTNKFKIKIFYSAPDVFFPNRRYQHLFVNNRPVSVNFLYAAIDSSVRSYISPGRYPLAYIYIDIDPELLDINIHPTKKEIKFLYQNEIFSGILKTVSEAFSNIVKRELIDITHRDFSQRTESVQNEFFQGSFDVDRSTNYFKSVIDNDLEKTTERATKTDQGYQVLGVVFETYIIVQKDNRILFIDQHAASEAILYQRKKEKYDGSRSIENLMIPAVFDVDDITGGLENKINTLKKADFDIEIGEGNSVVLKALPSILLAKKNYDLVVEIISEYLENDLNDSESELIDKILISASCKEAVKKGDKLTLLEMMEIVEEYFLRSITNCPHGRPSHFEMNRESLEKAFQRKK